MNNIANYLGIKTEKFDFQTGDTVKVYTKVVEGDSERIQIFDGVVLSRRKRLRQRFAVFGRNPRHQHRPGASVNFGDDRQQLIQALARAVNEFGEAAAFPARVVDFRLAEFSDRTGRGGQFRHCLRKADQPFCRILQNFIFRIHNDLKNIPCGR